MPQNQQNQQYQRRYNARQYQIDSRRNFNHTYDETPRTTTSNPNYKKRKNFLRSPINQQSQNNQKRSRNINQPSNSKQNSSSIDYDRLAQNVAIKFKGLDEKSTEIADTEVFLGHFNDVFITSDNIKEFMQHGLLNPKKMELIITSSRDLATKDLNEGKRCRCLIVRYNTEWWRDIVPLKNKNENMTDNSTLNTTNIKNTSITTTELKSMISTLSPIMQKVVSKYKPKRKFLVISDNTYISGILTFFATINDWILINENPVGMANLEEMDAKEKTECWGKRIGNALKRHKVFHSEITLSPDKVIDCNRL